MRVPHVASALTLRPAAEVYQAPDGLFISAAPAPRKGVQVELTKTGADLACIRGDLATERAEHVATRSQLQERLERVVTDLEQAEERATNAEAVGAIKVKAEELAAELAEALDPESRAQPRMPGTGRREGGFERGEKAVRFFHHFAG